MEVTYELVLALFTLGDSRWGSELTEPGPAWGQMPEPDTRLPSPGTGTRVPTEPRASCQPSSLPLCPLLGVLAVGGGELGFLFGFFSFFFSPDAPSAAVSARHQIN